MDWLQSAVKDHVRSGGDYSERTDPKGVLHTTESPSWPTYAGWTIPPHATIKARPGNGVDVRQHVSLQESAFALRNLGGGVQTNRDFAFQFELVGTCDPSTARQSGYYYWPEADDAVLIDLFWKVIFPVSVAFDIPLKALPFKPYPSSYGNTNVRLSPSEWDTYSGWCGHQHVPENVHGDPGNFPWNRMADLVMALTDDDVKKIWTEDIIPAPGDPVNASNPTWAPQSVLTYTANLALRTNKDLNAALAQLAEMKAGLQALTAAVAELRTAQSGVIEAAVSQAVATSLVQVDLKINGKVL